MKRDDSCADRSGHDGVGEGVVRKDGAIKQARKILGAEFTRLQMAYGGQKIYIPSWERVRRRPRSRLRLVLGDALAEPLCQFLAGEEVYVPLPGAVCYLPLDSEQKRRVRIMGSQGRSNNEIARFLGVSRRTVQKYKQKYITEVAS